MAFLDRRSLFKGLQGLKQRLEDRLKEAEGNEEPAISSEFRPTVDIYEQDENIVVECELPGIDRDNIDIRVDDERLTIQGERTRETKEEDEERNYYRSERRFESFQRSFTLPQNVDRERIEATYVEGILKVVLPEISESTSKQVTIE